MFVFSNECIILNARSRGISVIIGILSLDLPGTMTIIIPVPDFIEEIIH